MAGQHTPGPWTLDEDEIFAHDGAVPIARVYDAGHFPCAVDDGDGEHKGLPAECGANARLIAAAPELLHAVQRARRHAANNGINGGTYVAQLDAAIAKATGGV